LGLSVFLLIICGMAVAASRTLDISQKGKAFSQASVTIKSGDNLRFVNDDSVTHNVFAVGQNFSFNLKKQPPGTAATVNFPKPGRYECRCAIHPNMKLEVVVEK